MLRRFKDRFSGCTQSQPRSIKKSCVLTKEKQLPDSNKILELVTHSSGYQHDMFTLKIKTLDLIEKVCILVRTYAMSDG